MKERPILFSAPMVRALLAGTKTQTRRVVKPQPEKEHDGEPYWFVGGYRAWQYRTTQDVSRRGGNVLRCAYGGIGDRLWVREAWARDDEDGALFYRADVGTSGEADNWQRNIDDGAAGYRWRPSIHMPRAVSRITLEITGVRVERLHDISRGDAMAEGCPFPNMAHGHDPRQWYADLWWHINGNGSWDTNPWVWMVEFKVAPNASLCRRPGAAAY